MLEAACKERHSFVDNIVVDEAQDLTPLQWELILKIPCDNLIAAGDDDQSIYEWMGAASLMQEDFDEVKVLSKSYRLPLCIYTYAQKILKGIHARNPKQFSPNGEIGSLEFLSSYFDLIGNRSSLTVLVRDNYIKREVEDFCIQYLIPLKRILKGRLGKAFENNKQVPIKYMNYLIHFSGPDKSELPMWEVRTIHSSKGMEWDDVAIVCDLEGKASYALFSQEGREAEARVWYVAATRAKRSLKIIGHNLFMPSVN